MKVIIMIKSDWGFSKESAYSTAKIGKDATDNFGNRLIDGNLYIPAVLTVSTARENIISQYENALSDFEDMKPEKWVEPK